MDLFGGGKDVLQILTNICATAGVEIKLEPLNPNDYCSLRAARIKMSDFDVFRNIYIYVGVYIYIYIYISKYTYIYVCIYASISMHLCILHPCIYACMHLCIHASMHLSIYPSIPME